MKINIRYLLILSSVCFWTAFCPPSGLVMVLFLGFGFSTGFLIAKATPLSRLIPTRTVRTVVLYLISAIASVVFCACSVCYFHEVWKASGTLIRMALRFTDHYKLFLLCIYAVVGIGMFPFVFDVVTRMLYHGWHMLRSIRFASLWKYITQPITVKSTLKTVGMMVISLLLAASIGLALLTAAFLIPTEQIEKNVAKSALTVQKEGTYYDISRWFHSRLDNWTDSIILSEAAVAPETSALKAAIDVSNGTIAEKTPAEALVSHYVDGNAYDEYTEYSRYWHGYLILVKPLLTLMDYSAIRILNGIAQVLSMAILCVLLHKKGRKAYIIPILLCYLMLMPLALACSLQFSTCFYIIVLGWMALLLFPKQALERYVPWLFFTVGIATAYFDFLTYPIATYGLPCLLLLVLMDSNDPEKMLHQIIKCGFFWCIGYVGMWASKWMISHFVCGYELSEIFSSISERTSMTGIDTKTTLFHVEASNYFTFLRTPVTFLVFGYLSRKLTPIADRKEACRTAFPYLLIGAIPPVWYAFASNHSEVHYWFTNKACSVTLLAIVFALICISTLKKKEPGAP